MRFFRMVINNKSKIMDRNSTNYVLLFVVSMTVIVALMLTGIRQATIEVAEQNEDIFNKRAVLAAVNDHLGMGEGVKADDLTDEQVLEIFDTKVKQTSLNTQGQAVDGVMAEDIDMAKEKKKDVAERTLPLFEYSYEGNNFYILSVRGNGLWDEIWGYIALGSDKNTIIGASFDHQGETPGLGAEIKDNKKFPASFKGKKINDESGQFVSVLVKKGGAEKGNPHQVDGISGATVTADGVTEMLKRGLKYNEPYLKSLK